MIRLNSLLASPATRQAHSQPVVVRAHAVYNRSREPWLPVQRPPKELHPMLRSCRCCLLAMLLPLLAPLPAFADDWPQCGGQVPSADGVQEHTLYLWGTPIRPTRPGGSDPDKRNRS
jgi:hypothetical protein